MFKFLNIFSAYSAYALVTFFFGVALCFITLTIHLFLYFLFFIRLKCLIWTNKTFRSTSLLVLNEFNLFNLTVNFEISLLITYYIFYSVVILIFKSHDKFHSYFTHQLVFTFKWIFKCAKMTTMVGMCQYYVFIFLTFFKFDWILLNERIIKTEIKESRYLYIIHVICTWCFIPKIFNIAKFSIKHPRNLFFESRCTCSWAK